MLRIAAQRRPAFNLAKTLVQISVFWGVFLLALPRQLQGLEQGLALPAFHFPGQVPLASILFVALSALGLWSGVTIAWLGSGTPLPLDTARELVVRGPYAHVRNPMAVAGLGQGLVAGLGMGSVAVLLYVLAGTLLWQSLIRPREEQDLLHRFGPAYARYRQAVRCWVPRLRPYGG
jgi:protein-S-isoprenylcysteine O-methyltransferase Ste14